MASTLFPSVKWPTWEGFRRNVLVIHSNQYLLFLPTSNCFFLANCPFVPRKLILAKLYLWRGKASVPCSLSLIHTAGCKSTWDIYGKKASKLAICVSSVLPYLLEQAPGNSSGASAKQFNIAVRINDLRGDACLSQAYDLILAEEYCLRLKNREMCLRATVSLA